MESKANFVNQSWDDRNEELAGRLASVLEGTDPSIAVSALSIVAAVACNMAADYGNGSLRQVAERFVRGFERALPAAAATKLDGGERTH